MVKGALALRIPEGEFQNAFADETSCIALLIQTALVGTAAVEADPVMRTRGL